MSARSESVQNPKFMCHKKEQKQCKNQCVKLKIDIWPQRRGHSVNVWIETPCWDLHTWYPKTLVIVSKYVIVLCTWSITTHHTQASKVFKWMKWFSIDMLVYQRVANAIINHRTLHRTMGGANSTPVGFKGLTIGYYMDLHRVYRDYQAANGIPFAAS